MSGPPSAALANSQLACLLGGAVGDSLGLPFEGLSPRRIAHWWREPLAQRFVLGRGMLSDDTDHALFVAQSLLLAGGDVERFRRALAWRLRWWLLTLPAGIGWATLRSILRLWCFFPPARSGVWSAGNGPCMRAPLIGAHFAVDPVRQETFVDASTLLTHRDPRALATARAVADVAARIASGEWAQRPPIDALLAVLREAGNDADWHAAIVRIGECLHQPDPVAAARGAFGNRAGISGYALHTLPFALVVWYAHHGDYAQTLSVVIRAGGDTDSVAAIAGALAALSAGVDQIPKIWIDHIADWPHGTPRPLGWLARRWLIAESTRQPDSRSACGRAVRCSCCWCWPMAFAGCCRRISTHSWSDRSLPFAGRPAARLIRRIVAPVYQIASTPTTRLRPAAPQARSDMHRAASLIISHGSPMFWPLSRACWVRTSNAWAQS